MSEIKNNIRAVLQKLEQNQQKWGRHLSDRITALEAEVNRCKEVQTVLDESLNALAALSEELLKTSGKSDGSGQLSSKKLSSGVFGRGHK